MIISSVSRSYWRLIKQGLKTHADVVGEDKKAEIKQLAQEDVAARIITPERYRELTGEGYPGPAPSEYEMKEALTVLGVTING